MADIKNFGIKGIASDVQMGKSGGRLKYDSGNGRFDLTQSDGSTLEDLRLGSVTSGAWTATVIGSQYGGTGQDFSSSSGIIKVSGGTMSAGAVALASDVSGTLPVANGGTGATDAAGSRTNLGLGNLSVQASNAVNIDGGAIDGAIIGANSKAAISGTTVTFDDLSDGSITIANFIDDDTMGTASATTLATSESIKAYVDASMTGSDLDFQGDSGGALSIDLDSEVLDIAGGTGLTTVGSGNTLTVNIDDTVTAGSVGSASAIPVLTFNAQGQITAASTAAIVTSLTVDGDSGTADVDLSADDLQILGTANEIAVAVTKVGTDVRATVSLPDDVTIGNDLAVTNDLTVSGTLNSDDITSATVNITGDAVVSGNLTVNGTRSITNSTTVQVDDPTFELGDPGISSDDNLDRGIKFNWHNGTDAKIGFFGYDDSATEFVFLADATESSNTFTGTASALRTGAINAQAITAASFVGASGATLTGFADEDNMASDSATLGATQQSIKAYVDTTVSALSTSFTLDADSGSNDTFSIGGTLNLEGGTGLTSTVSNDKVSYALDDTAVTPASYGTTTAIPVLTIDQQGRITNATTAAISTSFTLQGDSGSQTVAGGDTLDIAGGTNITTVVAATDTATVNLDSTLTGMVAGTFSGLVTAGSFNDGVATYDAGVITNGVSSTFSGLVTAGSFNDGAATYDAGTISSGVAATFSGAVQGGSLTDGAATLSSGALSGATTVTASGAVTGGSLTDGAATLASGSLTGAVNITASGTITDGTASIASGAITGATDITASGTVEFGSLTDGTLTMTGFVDEDNMASNSAALIPTQQSVKAYVDSAITGSDLDFQGDSGGALSIDLDSEVLDIAGGTNVTTVGSGNTLTVNLDSTLTGLTSVTSSTLTDGTATMTGGALSGVTTMVTSGDVTVGGNLTVSGTQTSVNSTNTTITDTLITLQSGLTGANPNDIGHIYERGTDGNNGFLGWDQSTDRFIAATTTADGSTAGDLTLAAADFEAAGIIATGVTASGVVSFGTLTDSGESIAVTKFVDEGDGIANNDNDTSIPTSAAVVDYVANNGGDGLLVRAALATGATTSAVGTMPNVTGRTYYATKLVVKISTAVSGNNVNYITVTESGGNTLIAKADADSSTVGNYIVELDGDVTLAGGGTVTVNYFDASDNAVSPSAGAGVTSLYYNWTS